jgi:hypothetical protein
LADHVCNLPERQHPVGRALTAEEQTRLFVAAASNQEWEHVYCAAIVAANTSMRSRGCSSEPALRDAAGLQRLRFHDLRHTAITELAEMGVADHVLESITGHLSRRMLEHYSHILIDAKRQALDALDVQRGRVLPEAGNGNGGDPQNAEIKAIIEVPDSVTSRSRHSLTLSGSPPHGKLLIPFERRDVRVVEGARLESVCRGNSTEGSNPSLSAK